MNNTKKTLLVAACSILASTNILAQEHVLDSVAKNTMPTLLTGTGMNQMSYALYEKAGGNGKMKFVTLDGFLNPVNSYEIDANGLGTVVTFASSEQSSLYLFFDEKKKTGKLVSFGPDGKQIGQKNYKTISSVNDDVQIFNSINPEDFVVVIQTVKKAGYTIEAIDKDLNIKWSKSKSKTMIEAKQEMDMVNIISRNKSPQGGESYNITSIQIESGDEVSDNVLKKEEQPLYPIFFDSKDGMTFNGGLFFKDGNPNNKTPDGIYLAQIGPDGSIAEIMTTPYSLVIEDLKGSLTEQMASGTKKMLPVGAMRKMDGSGTILLCELFSRKKTADGNTRFEVMELVAIEYDLEQRYKSLKIINKPNKSTTISGIVAKATDDWSVAKWMLENNFFDFKLIKDVGGQQVVAYTTIKNDEQNICFNNLNGSDANCSPFGNRILRGSSSNASYNSNTKTIANVGILSSTHEGIAVYEYKNPQVLLYTLPLIAGEMRHEEMHHQEEGEPNNQQEEQPQHEEAEPPHHEEPPHH